MSDRINLAEELEHRVWDGFLSGGMFIASALQFEKGNEIIAALCSKRTNA